MASPPAKRQRRLAVLSSDDEERPPQKPTPAHIFHSTNRSLGINRETIDSVARDASIVKPKTSAKVSLKPAKRASTKTTPTTSPEKARSKPSTPSKAGESKSLHSFFQAATEEQRWKRQEEHRTVVKAEVEVDDDLIEDDSLDEAFLSIPDGAGPDKSILDRRKQLQTKVPENGGSFTASQKFLKPAGLKKEVFGEGSTAGEALDASQRPWADRYAPKNLDELAVHKKKVADVQRWLVGAVAGLDRHRLLVLKGPAGSGKSTTVSLVADLLGLDVVEWRNPLGSEYTSQGFVSVAAQFEEFLGRSGDFGALELGDGNASGGQSKAATTDAGKRIITVEEFPNTFGRSSSTLQSFRSTILRFLAANAPPVALPFANGLSNIRRRPPMIMLVSETLLTSSTALTDSFTAHRLLGPEISNHPSTTMIEFNPVAPSFITKALELVIKKEARSSKRRRIPGPAVLRRLSEMGDVRSAVGSLEFLCLRGDDGNDWSGRVAAKLKKSDKGGLALTKMERDSLELVTQREASLGIFHAVGKVVYNKRQDPVTSMSCIPLPLPQPPEHLGQFFRPQVSGVGVEDLIDETGTDTHTFLSALHENYVLSCDGAGFVDSTSDCADHLSESDILNSDIRRGFQGGRAAIGSARANYQGTGVDLLRRDEICFQVAVRGLLFSLPYPVKRVSRPGGTRGDAFKMFYPTSLRLWRQTEEIDGYIDVWMDRIMRNIDYHTSRTDAGKKAEGVESWKLNNLGAHPEGTDSEEAVISRPMISRDDVLLERLPYQAKITTAQDMVRDLGRITQFHGIGLQAEEAPDEESAFDAMDEDVRSKLWSPRKRDKMRGGTSQANSIMALLDVPMEKDMKMEKLVLSDDDIED